MTISKSVKVLMLVSSLRKAGPIIVVQNILKNINRKLIDVEIVKLMDDEPERSITSEFEDDGFIVHELHLSKILIEVCPKREAAKLNALIKSINPDIIHIHGYQCNRIITHLFTYVPILETIHSILPEDYRMTYGRLIGSYMTSNHLKGLKKVTAIAAISNTVKKFCETNLINKDIECIYNGVKVPKPISRQEARMSLNLNPKTRVFTVIGTLSFQKDPLTVIRAFLQAFSEGDEDVRLIFVGKGPLMKQCRKTAETEQRIEFIGWSPLAYTYLVASDYSICASKSEGFGLNFIESLINGTPVIGSSIPTFKEFFNLFPELGKYSFTPGDVDSLAHSFYEAYNNTIDMNNFKTTICDMFTAPVMSFNYTRKYLALVGQKQAEI